jgi:hypothetical protein
MKTKIKILLVFILGVGFAFPDGFVCSDNHEIEVLVTETKGDSEDASKDLTLYVEGK